MSVPWDLINSINLTFVPNLACKQQSATKISWDTAVKGLFDVFLTSKGENVAFPPRSSPCSVVPLFELPLENNKHPNFEWRGWGRGVDSYVLWSYPIWVQHMSQQFCRQLKLSNYGEATSEPQENTRVSGKAAHVAVWLLATPPNLYLNHWSDWRVQLRFEFIYPYHAQHKTAATEPLTIPTTD